MAGGAWSGDGERGVGCNCADCADLAPAAPSDCGVCSRGALGESRDFGIADTRNEISWENWLMDMELMVAQLTSEEGTVPYAYPDSRGYLTIGVGHCIDKRLGCKLPPNFIQQLLEWDINAAVADLDNSMPWWTGLDEVRQRVMVDMCFNMGLDTLQGFKKFLAAMQAGAWATAAAEMQDSAWWGQVKGRAVRLQQMVLTGVAE